MPPAQISRTDPGDSQRTVHNPPKGKFDRTQDLGGSYAITTDELLQEVRRLEGELNKIPTKIIK